MRAEEQFLHAVQCLQKALPKHLYESLGLAKFAKIDSTFRVEDAAAEIEAAINTLVTKPAGNKPRKASEMAKKCFCTSVPFARVFLNVASLGSAVCLREKIPILQDLDTGSQSVRAPLWWPLGTDHRIYLCFHGKR